jgi:signal transduction histidine kinase
MSVRAPRSLAQRLFASAVLWSVLILLIAGLILSGLYRRSAEAAFDGRLGVYLRAIVADVATPGDDTRTEPGQLGDPQFELSLSGWYWQITPLSQQSAKVKASRSLFASRLPRLADQGVKAEIGEYRHGTAQGPDGRTIRLVERVIETDEEGKFLIQVAAATDQLESDIHRFEYSLAATFILLALALGASTMAQVRFGLSPLRRLQSEVTAIRRGEGDRIEGAFPPDLAPLAGELNLLISSNREIVERARTQVGNLAHALKTPLSVITNEAEADPSPLSGKVREQAQVMRDQVNYYLDKARAAARSNVVGNTTDAVAATEQLVRTFQKIYRDGVPAFETQFDGELRFRGEEQDFQEMLGNLLDNAGKWASSNVLVSLSLEAGAAGSGQDFLILCVDDDGPGLPPEDREQALKRGRRLDETKPGSGLGLSIVGDLAAVYAGDFTLEDGVLGGLRARLRLPAA